MLCLAKLIDFLGLPRVSMDQSAKDSQDTSDHKCILIWDPAYKYKHYKFLKSEGLVGAVPVQRLPQKLDDTTCSSFIISS